MPGLPLLAVLALALVALTACSPARGVEAWRMLSRLAAAEPAASARPVQIAYGIDGRQRRADLYRPVERAGAALVLVPGAAREGRRDPRLMALAGTLADAQFLVLVPEIEGLRGFRLSPENRQPIADAVRRLAATLPPGGEPGLGLMAISYAVGPAILAALDPEVGRHLRYIVAVGGYYDVTAAVTRFTTGCHRTAATGPWRCRPPNEYAKWLFARSNAERLDDPRDQALLAEIAERRMADPPVPSGGLPARLGPEGRAVLRLLENRLPERVPALIAALPEPIRDDLRALDLSARDLSRLIPRLILVHGRDDPVIPHGESVALAAAAPAAELYLVDSLAHADLDPFGLGDAVTLWQAVYRVLEERDRAPAPRWRSPATRPPVPRSR